MADDKDKTLKVSKPDLDALDTLPLSMIPLASNTLRNAKLIKNSRMETAVELYNDPIAGSLQIYPEDIADQIAASDRDQEIISQLAGLHSYDVYSLRSSLKKLGIDVADEGALQLSADMKESLSDLTVHFTRPLIEKIFGSGRIDPSDTDALQKVFRDPDVDRVRENLKTMTEVTGIPLEDIPGFLEDYSDVFLSVAYYRYCFENIGRETDRFLAWVQALRTHRDVSSNPRTAASCKKVEEDVRFLITSIRERLLRFQVSFELFWNDIGQTSFRNLREQVEENHSSMGSILCGLSVKISGWSREFPDDDVGGPATRAKYVVTHMEPGLDKLKSLETAARQRLGMAAAK